MINLRDKIVTEAISAEFKELVEGINKLSEIALNNTSGKEQTEVRELSSKLVELANKVNKH